MLDEVGCWELGSEGYSQAPLLAPISALLIPNMAPGSLTHLRHSYEPQLCCLSHNDGVKVNPMPLSCFLTQVLLTAVRSVTYMVPCLTMTSTFHLATSPLSPSRLLTPFFPHTWEMAKSNAPTYTLPSETLPCVDLSLEDYG